VSPQGCSGLPGYSTSIESKKKSFRLPDWFWQKRCATYKFPRSLSLCSFFGGVPVLPESAGYGIVLGFGVFFSIFTTTLVSAKPSHPIVPLNLIGFSKKNFAQKETTLLTCSQN
jgi:hypothetical protein